MSKKFHSGLKRTLAWMLVVALTVQGCMVVYADDFTSEPDAAVVSEEISDADVDADNDLEVVEDEDTTDDVDISDDSNEDVDSDVTVEEEQADESGTDEFSDGSDLGVSEVGAEAVGNNNETVPYNLKDQGTYAVAGNEVYEYHRYTSTDAEYVGHYRFAVGNYPVSGTTSNMSVSDTRQFVIKSLVATDHKRATEDVATTQWLTDTSRSSSSSPSYYPYSTVKWQITGGSSYASISGSATSTAVTIKANAAGDAVLTGTWTGWNCKTSDKKEACKLVVTYNLHITAAPAKVDMGEEFTVNGSPTSQDIVNNGKILTEKDSWAKDNNYINYKSSGDGMANCTISYKNYPGEVGTVSHNYYIDFHEMIAETLSTSLSPDERAKLTETFVRNVNPPASGIYLVTKGPINIPKRGNTSSISTQAFNGGTGLDTKPTYEFLFKDEGETEYSAGSEIVTATKGSSSYITPPITVKALKPGTTSMKIRYSYTEQSTKEAKTAESEPIQITVSGIQIDEPETLTLSADESTDHKIKYRLLDYTKENPDVTTSIPEKDIEWSIDNKAIASISTDGVIRPKKEGSATVTLKATINGYQDTATQGVAVTSTGGKISLNKDTLTMTKGSSQSLTATAYFNNQKVSDAVFNWATDNDKVAAVENGKITAVGFGKAVITVSWKAENGTTYAAKADVEVVQNGIYLADAQNEVTMPQGSTQEIAWTLWNMGQYKAGSTGEGYNTSSDVTWKSADESVATVDSDGVITAKNLPEGQTTASTTVTVSYKGKKVKDIRVNVTENQKVVVKGEAVEITGTKGETKTDSAGEDITDTWKIGYFENGHGSLNAQFYGNGIYNIDIVKQAGEKVSVTGKTPYSGYIYLSHKYYVPMETGQLYGVWQSIAIKVNGEAGLYLNENSVSMKMGKSGTATIQGTFIKDDGTELEQKFWANKSNPKLSKLEMVEGDTNIVTAQSDPADGRMLHLTAVSPGKTTITIKCYPFDPTATCEVEVTSDARLILQPAELTVKQGTTEKITAKAWDGSAYVDNPQITWKSYNESIATVDGGVVTGVKRGNATVSAAWNGVNANDVKVIVTPSRNITLSTEWDDHDNQDGIRPEKATLQLTANDENYGDPIELNAENNWTYEWKLLDAEDAEGNNIVYRVKAEDPEEYTAKVTGSADDGFVVTYSHEIAKVSATANVTWDDAENQDGIRPASVSLQLKSKVEGGEAVNVGDNVTVKADADGNWTKTWTDLPKYNAGKVIEYTVEESGLPEGYTITTAKDEETGAITLKNSYTPKGVDIAVSVNWNDADNQDGLRPEFVEAELYAGNTSTGKKVKLTADNEWKATFEKMAVNKNGKPIEYSLVSTKAEGYEIETTGSATEGLVLNYTHAVKTVDVKATVVWEDGNNKDDVRPETVSLQLKADGENLGDVITVNEKSKWTKTWTGLDQYKAGTKVTYEVEVVGLKGGEDGYTAEITGDAGTGFTITATHVPAVADIKASVNWVDADNQDAIRPELVEAELYAGDVSTGKKVKLTADNKWAASFGEMDLKKDGITIDYTLVATKVDGYDCVVEGAASQGFTLKFTHKTETVDVTLTTEWNDKDNQDNVRPASYYVQLLADDVKVGDKIILESASDFSKTWTGLQKNRTGKVGEAIVYTAEVTGLPESYETSVRGDAATGLVVKNTYIPATVEIPVSVKWDDAENQDGARLDSVEAELYADGEATENKVTLNAENNWTAKFASVDVKKDGTRIKYEVKGTEADGYDVSVAGDILDEKGLVLTYKHIPAVVNVSARASWNDANNQDGIRPTDTLVQLYADGTALGDKAVIESNKEWTKTWSDLPKYKAGKEIAYSVIAYAVSGYTVKVTGSALEGYKAEYTHNVQKMNVTVQNAWNDLDNVVDSRPAQLVVEIYANGKTTGKRVTLTEANNWKATVSGLDRNAAGKRIQYTGKAVGTPAGYNISVSTDANGNIKLISNFTTYTKKLRLKLSKTSYVYNGKNAKPKVTVYNGRKKVSRKYYKVTYKNNKNTGYATVIVKGKGKFAKYAGKATFTIKPKTPKKPVVKKGAKKTLNVRWYRDAQATKYVVQYSQSSKFKGRTTKTVTINSNKTGKIVLKGLTSRKNYYVRVRSCKVVNGKAIWGSYSKATKMKVK